MNDASGRLYVTTTSEQDQFTIDNYSGKTFQDGETVPLADYFRIGGYFGSYGPHLFAAAPKMAEILKFISDLLEHGDGQIPVGVQEHIFRRIDAVLKQAQGDQA